MRKFLGREPRCSREEIERQAQEAIDARVRLGRPPAEDWQPLEMRMDEIDRAIVARQAVARPLLEPEPVRVAEVRRPAEPTPVRPRAGRRPVAARPSAH